VEFTLPPRTYALHATAPDYDRAVARPPIDLYAPCEIPLELGRAAPAPSESSGNGGGAQAPEEPGPTADLVVRTNDPLVPVEVADQAGRVLQVSNGGVSLTGLAAGFYRVRLIPPGGAVDEQVVELAPGDKQIVDLEPSTVSPAVKELVDRISAPVHADNTVEVSADAGPIASPEISTILTLAAGAAINQDAKDTNGLHSLGLDGIDSLGPAAETGLYAVLGHDSSDGAQAESYFAGLKLRIWKVGEPVPEAFESARVATGASGVAEFAGATTPGPYWFSLEPPQGKPIVVALATLPKRLTLLTIEVQPSMTKIFQYSPSLAPDSSSDAEVLRSIELLERIMLDGRLDAGYELAQQLLARQVNNPLAGCLGSYLYLRLGRTGELEDTVKSLTTRFPGLSDAHVIRGEFEAAAGRAAEAKAAFAQAIEVGVPIFGEGLTRLLEGMRTYEIEHPLARLVEHIFSHHMSGSMWSVWQPDELKPGELVVP
jgi:hypothetical protein